MDDRTSELRRLPAVDAVLASLGGLGDPASLTEAARDAVESARADVKQGSPAPSIEDIVARARDRLAVEARRDLQPVINATGVLIHTNLGRVPLGREQLAAVTEVAGGYSNLEYDLPKGRRGTRYEHARSLLVRLTGADDAVVVNNNAAAVLVTLAALCSGREVIISRGELVEIGGEFRIPEVMAAAGVRLVEVGTTNRTHVVDYEKAIGPDTAAILKVHPSNYRVVGFTATVAARDLARLALGHKVYFLHDLGSGLVGSPGKAAWGTTEPEVGTALRDGADVVTFSGDKLLGGPQAGIVLGRARLVTKIERHPLMRAVRVDKMTLAALQATLRMHLENRAGDLPLWAMASVSEDGLRERAVALCAQIERAAGGGQGADRLEVEAVPTRAVAGGGALPGAEVGSWAVALRSAARSADDLARRLRAGRTPVVGRIEEDRLLLDLRTVPPELDLVLAELVCVAAASRSVD